MKRPDLEFSALGLHHETAIADYVSEFARAGESIIHGYFGKADWGHAETVKKLAAWSRGEDLAGWVPNSTRFLINNGRIIGNYNFRHELTESLKRCGGNCGYSVRPSERRKGYGTMLLANAKDFGRTLGLDRILVTCSVDNIGSSRVIERNGGVFEDVVHDEESNENISRYWITL
jgi:predicted acetyltransferase